MDCMYVPVYTIVVWTVVQLSQHDAANIPSGYETAQQHESSLHSVSFNEDSQDSVRYHMLAQVWQLKGLLNDVHADRRSAETVANGRGFVNGTKVVGRIQSMCSHHGVMTQDACRQAVNLADVRSSHVTCT